MYYMKLVQSELKLRKVTVYGKKGEEEVKKILDLLIY